MTLFESNYDINRSSFNESKNLFFLYLKKTMMMVLLLCYGFRHKGSKAGSSTKRKERTKDANVIILTTLN